MIFPYKDENPTYNTPVLTVVLIAINVLFYFKVNMFGSIETVAYSYGFVPSKILFRPHTLLTSMFLHGGLFHLIGNMWFFWLFGDNIEDKFGRLKFIQLFIFAGIIGNLTHALFTFFMGSTPVIGASGAVAGIMGAYLATYPTARIRCIFLLIFYPIFFNLHAFILLAGWMIFEFLSGFLNPGSMTAHWAHVGGFAYGFVWAYKRRSNSGVQ
jgi:membrane associated rhomboid family serine protease